MKEQSVQKYKGRKLIAFIRSGRGWEDGSEPKSKTATEHGQEARSLRPVGSKGNFIP